MSCKAIDVCDAVDAADTDTADAATDAADATDAATDTVSLLLVLYLHHVLFLPGASEHGKPLPINLRQTKGYLKQT